MPDMDGLDLAPLVAAIRATSLGSVGWPTRAGCMSGTLNGSLAVTTGSTRTCCGDADDLRVHRKQAAAADWTEPGRGLASPDTPSDFTMAGLLRFLPRASMSCGAQPVGIVPVTGTFSVTGSS